MIRYAHAFLATLKLLFRLTICFSEILLLARLKPPRGYIAITPGIFTLGLSSPYRYFDIDSPKDDFLGIRRILAATTLI